MKNRQGAEPSVWPLSYVGRDAPVDKLGCTPESPFPLPMTSAQSSRLTASLPPSLVDMDLRGVAPALLLSLREVPELPFPKWFVDSSVSVPLGCSVGLIVDSSVTTSVSPPASQSE